MPKNYQIDNHEIDLIKLMFTVWKGKWKVIIAVFISLITAIIYQSNQSTNFSSITEVKPLNTLETKKYLFLNSIVDAFVETKKSSSSEIFLKNEEPIDKGITNLTLLDLYIDILRDRSIFEDAIRKFNLLEASQYRNDQEYSEAIIRLASSIEIISPQVYNQTTKENLTSSYYTINFIYSNAEKWKSALIYIDEIANKNVKKNIIKQINYAISNLEEKQKFRLEDIKVEIKNHFIDYERLVSDRVSYLKEQSEIAKRLGIAKNTIEVQTFGNILSNVQTDSPFYLRGYEAINKEIELMEGRENKKAFIGGLMDLEQSKRVIEQDKTIERTKLIVKSALLNNNEFSAASVDIAGTKFTYKNYNKLFGIAILIGLIVGMFFVIISNEFRLYKINK